MRILVVAPTIKVPDTHGGSTHVGELTAALARRAEVCLLAAAGSSGPGVVAVGHRTTRVPVLRTLAVLADFPAAYAAARAFAPHAIYERGHAYGLGALLARALGVPSIAMVLDEHYSRLSLWTAKRLIATNTDLVPPAWRYKAVKVSWGANAERFRPDVDPAPARARLGIAGRCTVVYTGSFRAWHGIDTIIDAAARLDDSWRFVLVGDGPERPALEARAAAAGAAGRIVFTGAVAYDEVPGIVAAADACVAPFDPSLHPLSRERGFTLDPLKVFEYLAAGKPTVTVRAGNIEGLFDDGVHLRMIAPRDVDALVTNLIDLRARPAAAAALGAAGRARVLERYTWQAHADQLMRLFAEIGAGDGGGGGRP